MENAERLPEIEEKKENADQTLAPVLVAPKSGGEDADSFHSVPTSPMETVKVE